MHRLRHRLLGSSLLFMQIKNAFGLGVNHLVSPVRLVLKRPCHFALLASPSHYVIRVRLRYNIIQVQRPGDDIESFPSEACRSYAKPKASSTLVPLELASTPPRSKQLLSITSTVQYIHPSKYSVCFVGQESLLIK